MNFESLTKTVSSKVADVGAQKATETLDQANLLLKLLQDAGYQVREVDVELGVLLHQCHPKGGADVVRQQA